MAGPSRFYGPSNRNIQLLASAARTAAISSPDQVNHDGRGLHVVIDVTLDPALASITPTIEGKDKESGKYYALLVGNAIAATGTTVLKVYPGIVASANVAASDVLPPIWRVSIAVADADSMTYSVGAAVMV